MDQAGHHCGSHSSLAIICQHASRLTLNILNTVFDSNIVLIATLLLYLTTQSVTHYEACFLALGPFLYCGVTTWSTFMLKGKVAALVR